MEEQRDEHIVEAIGKSGILIMDGKIIEVGSGLITRCPLAERFAKHVHQITPKAVEENFSNRIAVYEMCTTGLKLEIIDCAVLSSEGAGTVIVTSPELGQGIDGRMSGLGKKFPLPGIIRKIEQAGGIVLDTGTIFASAER